MPSQPTPPQLGARKEASALALQMAMPAPEGRLEAKGFEQRIRTLVRLLPCVQGGAPLLDDLELERRHALERRGARRAQQLEGEALRVDCGAEGGDEGARGKKERERIESEGGWRRRGGRGQR